MSLEPTVDHIAEQNAAMRRALDIITENEWLRESCAAKGLLVPDEPNRSSMAVIAEIVAARHLVSVAQLKGKEQARYVAWPRQEAMWLMRQIKTPAGHHRFSYPQIGRFLGGRDHTTVLYGERAHVRRSLVQQGAA